MLTWLKFFIDKKFSDSMLMLISVKIDFNESNGLHNLSTYKHFFNIK